MARQATANGRGHRGRFLARMAFLLAIPVLSIPIFSTALLAVPARAEPLAESTIIRDGSLGIDPIQETSFSGGTTFEIGESNGYRPGGAAGINLLHSFGRFELAAEDTANFSADYLTENIVVRVPNSPTIIEGRVNTRSVPNTNANTNAANLYWLSPQGVIFGENAELNVGGSLSVSTADSLSFDADGQSQTFEARSNGAVPTLAMARPEAFGFLGESSSTVR